jgi:hypothetical protein
MAKGYSTIDGIILSVASVLSVAIIYFCALASLREIIHA